jgi:hypothetical protein
MDEEAVHLRERFSRLTDEELLRVVTADRAEYRRAALDLAASEIVRRRLPLPRADISKQQAADEEWASQRDRFFNREQRTREAMAVLFALIPFALASVAVMLVKPGDFGLTVLFYLVAYAACSVVLRAAWRKFFPASFEIARAEAERAERDEAEAERLKSELRGAAEDALEGLGLEWRVGDVYRDSYGYHVDFYDGNHRLRSLVFERPATPGAGWFTPELVRRLRELPAETEPEPERFHFPTSQTLG